MSEAATHLKIKLATQLACALLLVAADAYAEGQVLEPLRQPQRLGPRSEPAVERVILPEPQRSPPQPATDLRTAHLASYYTEDDAYRGWEVLLDQYGDLLEGYRPMLHEVDLGERGVFVRLLAGPLRGQGEADDLCAAIRSACAYCVPADAVGAFLLPLDGPQ